jgi:methyl-accepting chemotaxis protein
VTSLVNKQSIGIKVSAFIVGLIFIVIAGFVFIISESNNVTKMSKDLRENDLSFNNLVKQAYTNFLIVDDQSNMWVGLGTSKSQFGDQKLADDTLSQVKTAEVKLTTALRKLNSFATNPQETSDIKKTQKDSETYLSFIDQVIAINESNHLKAQHIMYIDNAKISNSFTNDLDKLNNHVTSRVNQKTDTILNFMNSESKVIWISGILSVLIGLFVIWYVLKLIRPLGMVTEQVVLLSKGDLTSNEIKVKNKDEIGNLANAFNQMLTNFRELIQRVSLNAEQVASFSEQLSVSAEQTSKATEQIAIEMQEVAVGSEKQVTGTLQATQAVYEISKSMNEATISIQSVVKLSSSTNEYATRGTNLVLDTVEQMNDLQQKVSSTAKVVNTLGAKTKEISSIVQMITQIANQTNLLALNASIEAARAGEHGKGFAVVADEIGKLAQKSRDFTEEIHKLISEIQSESIKTVQSMNEGKQSVDVGIVRVNQTGETFQEIVKMIEEVTIQTRGVSSVVEKANHNSETLVDVINGVASISEQTSSNTQNVATAVEEQNATMQEITSSAEALSRMTIELQEVVNKFKV